MTTAADIRNLIESRIESDPVPDAILAYLRERDGKTLTQRDIPKLRALAKDNVYLRKRAGMTHLDWSGGGLLIAYTEGAPVINAEWVKDRNLAYFDARTQRNVLRKTALSSAQPERVAELVNAINAAAKELLALIVYDAPLSPDRYAIEKLVTTWTD